MSDSPPMEAIAVALAIAASAAAAQSVPPVAPNAGHVERWNRFADAVYALHQKITAARRITTEERIGGYYRWPKFYREVKYRDADSGRLLSIIQWERERPERIHWIEVYVYDERGRVVRDYSAAYLPFSRTAPQQTIITFYAYNHGGRLRAYRQFDATDNRIYEFCEGTYRGEPVRIDLWELDIIEETGKPGGVMTTEAYRACFEGLPVESAGKYLTPQ